MVLARRGADSSTADVPHGFIFLGTPHHGSGLTVAARFLALLGYWAGSNTNLLDAIDRESPENQRLHDDFLENFKIDTDKIECFYETAPEVVAGFSLHTVSKISMSKCNKPVHY